MWDQKTKQTNKQNRNRLIVTENTPVVATGGVGGGKVEKLLRTFDILIWQMVT